MNEIKTKEPVWENEPPLYGPRYPLLLIPFILWLWAAEGTVAVLAQTWDCYFRWREAFFDLRGAEPGDEEDRTV